MWKILVGFALVWQTPVYERDLPLPDVTDNLDEVEDEDLDVLPPLHAVEDRASRTVEIDNGSLRITFDCRQPLSNVL